MPRRESSDSHTVRREARSGMSSGADHADGRFAVGSRGCAPWLGPGGDDGALVPDELARRRVVDHTGLGVRQRVDPVEVQERPREASLTEQHCEPVGEAGRRGEARSRSAVSSGSSCSAATARRNLVPARARQSVEVHADRDGRLRRLPLGSSVSRMRPGGRSSRRVVGARSWQNGASRASSLCAADHRVARSARRASRSARGAAAPAGPGRHEPYDAASPISGDVPAKCARAAIFSPTVAVRRLRASSTVGRLRFTSSCR